MASADTVLPRLPRLRQTIEALPASSGDLFLLQPSGESDLVIRDATLEVTALLAALDGTRSVAQVDAELGARFPDLEAGFVEQSVRQLQELGLVEDAAADADAGLSPDELLRYDRQLAYFGELTEAGGSRAAAQARLKESHVVVLGLGGLGGWALYALACAGIGRIDGYDHDRVELSNLNRQILYSLEDVGTPKAEAAARRLAAFNPHVDFRAHDEQIASRADVERAVDGADFVVAMADWPPHDIERWVNDACFAVGVPYVSAGQFPPRVRVGPTYVPGRTGCYRCAEERHRREFPHYDELVEARRGTPSLAATFAPACALIGAVVSADVVHHLTGLAEPSTLGTALVFDLRTMETTREDVAPEPGCPVCSARLDG